MASDGLFVWIYLPDQTGPVIAGRLTVRKTAAREGVATITSLDGFPGVIMDAAPDRWGKRVIDGLIDVGDYPASYLLINAPGRAGALAFSANKDQFPVDLKESRSFVLSELMDASRRVEANEPVEPDLLIALHPGTGGARPKCNIIEDKAVWIAKFSSVADDPAINPAQRD